LLLKKRDEYYREGESLSKKKEKLFTAKNYRQWGLTQEELKNAITNNYITDKVMATSLMLPKETKNLKKVFLDYGFSLNKVLDGIERMNVREYKELREHIKKTFSEYRTILDKEHKDLSDSLVHLDEDISIKPQQYRKGIIKQNLIKLSTKTNYIL
jgi:hypothetical protein